MKEHGKMWAWAAGQEQEREFNLPAPRMSTFEGKIVCIKPWLYGMFCT